MKYLRMARVLALLLFVLGNGVPSASGPVPVEASHDAAGLDGPSGTMGSATDSQSVSGAWSGWMLQPGGRFPEGFRYSMSLAQGNARITGTARLETLDGRNFGLFSINGTVEGAVFSFTDVSIIDQLIDPGGWVGRWCIKTARLTIETANSLTGPWTAPGCLPGTITLTRSQSSQCDSRCETIKRLYREMLGREADQGGLQAYYSSGMTESQVRTSLCSSDEARLPGKPRQGCGDSVQPRRGTIVYGQVVSGTIGPREQDFWTFTGNQGERAVIEMRGFDTYLYLNDPSGSRIAEDDDSLGYGGSRVIIDLSYSGAYTIIAAGYGNRSGVYHLSVQCGNFACINNSVGARILDVPYLSQWNPAVLNGENNCGPASLAMAVSYYGRLTSVADARSAYRGNSDGPTRFWDQYSLEYLARFGLREEPVSNSSELVGHIAQGHPVVALVNNGSYVRWEDGRWAPYPNDGRYIQTHIAVVTGYELDFNGQPTAYYINDPLAVDREERVSDPGVGKNFRIPAGAFENALGWYGWTAQAIVR